MSTLDGGSILVPLDGSELAEGALAHAFALGKATGVELVFLSVFGQVELRSMEERKRHEDAGLSQFTSYLTDVRTRAGYPNARIAVAFGWSSDEIIETAQKMGASMIVMASHGRSGISRWMYGSTTWNVVQRSDVPVMVVNQQALRPIDADVGYSHILVPLDGSELAERALEPARSLVHAFGARVSLARVVQPVIMAYPYTAPVASDSAEIDERVGELAREYLEGRSNVFSATTRVDQCVLYGSAAPQLVDLAESGDVDLIVMTTHGRSGVGRAVLGSVAERMLHGKVPVILVPPSKH
jgi:nucleotide-binding universal stress UspA family protein